MLKKNVLRLLAMLLLTVMLFVTVACNTVYDIRTDDMDKPWEDGEPDEDGTDKNNGNNNNNVVKEAIQSTDKSVLKSIYKIGYEPFWKMEVDSQKAENEKLFAQLKKLNAQ